MKEDSFSAWNPGIVSKIPEVYEHLETIFDPSNTFTSPDEIKELSAQTGLEAQELVVFRPARLALHEIILRITADIVVLESDQEEALGINFREIAHKIFDDYIKPSLASIDNKYEAMRIAVSSQIEDELDTTLFASNKHDPVVRRWWQLRPSKPTAVSPVESTQEREHQIINSFKDKGLQADDAQTSAIYRSMYRVLGALANKRGFLGQDRAFLVKLCTHHVSNFYGTRIIGKIVRELVIKAINEQDYQMIPDTEHAILISLKGTSASGKSSLRPRLREFMSNLGIHNGCYGTISPDIWRRLLLDYESLGDAYKYAGRLTSYEVNIIDSKLDQYIRGKAEIRQSIPHLMVDRFRFDSFASEKVSRVLHKTYVKYIDTMYMYFIITPPEETVERGWTRGLSRGRYKSVEDFLAHSVEAYKGIPRLLFKYLSSDQPHFEFEFLNNDVPLDHYPLLIAKGTQGSIDIFDPIGFTNIVGFQKINIMAQTAEEVYQHNSLFEPAKNLDFLKQCIEKIETVNFTDLESNKIYLTFQNRRIIFSDEMLLKQKRQQTELDKILTLLMQS